MRQQKLDIKAIGRYRNNKKVNLRNTSSLQIKEKKPSTNLTNKMNLSTFMNEISNIIVTRLKALPSTDWDRIW